MTITPDSKDWTWVLEQRCPDCGFDCPTTDFAEVSALIRRNGDQWRLLLDHSDVVVRNRPNNRTWSTLEYGCHVRDVYRIGHYRILLMLDEDNPLFPNWDQDETAVYDEYGAQDPRQVIEELQAAANGLANLLDGVSDAQWDRPGRRSDGARFTVGSFARYVTHDPVHHVWDVGKGFEELGGDAGR